MQKKEDIYTVHKKFYTRKPKKKDFFALVDVKNIQKVFLPLTKHAACAMGWRVTMGYMARPAITQPTAQVA